MFLLQIFKKGVCEFNWNKIYKSAEYIFFYKLGCLCKTIEDCYGVFDPGNLNTWDWYSYRIK